MATTSIKNMRTRNMFGKVKAFFTLSFGPIEVDDLRLIEGSNGLFVGFPSKKIKAKDGTEKYIDLVRLSRDSEGDLTESAQKVYDEIFAAAKKEFDRREGATTASAPEDSDDLPF